MTTLTVNPTGEPRLASATSGACIPSETATSCSIPTGARPEGQPVFAPVRA